MWRKIFKKIRFWGVSKQGLIYRPMSRRNEHCRLVQVNETSPSTMHAKALATERSLRSAREVTPQSPDRAVEWIGRSWWSRGSRSSLLSVSGIQGTVQSRLMFRSIRVAQLLKKMPPLTAKSESLLRTCGPCGTRTERWRICASLSAQVLFGCRIHFNPWVFV